MHVVTRFRSFTGNFLVSMLVGLVLSVTVAGQTLEIHHINVGQGTSILIIGPNGTTILFDGGRSGKGTGEVVPYLQSLGITTATPIDYMILSHRDTDHMNGLTEVINAGYDCLHIYDNGSDKMNTSIQNFLDAAATTTAGGVTPMPLGLVIDLGNGATATCVVVNGEVIGSGPVNGALNNENDRCVGLLVQYGNFDFLACGDLGGGSDDNACTGRSTGQVNVETPLAQAIMPGGANPLLSSFGVEVLHVNHHGSESSTNSDYMNLLTPAVAMISVGAGQGSTWNHPRIDVVEHVLLAQASCVTAASALVLQTEEGSPTGSQTSFAGYCVGDIVLTTDGVSSYTITATGDVTQGPNEVAAAGLPVTFNFDEGATTTSSVVISEVFYDTPGTDSQEEWVELYNNGASTVDVGGWTITDNNGAGSTFTIPAGKTIAPGTFLTVAANQAGFTALYGYDADVYGSLPALNNTGDALILKDASGQQMDAVAWEGGASNGIPPGWGSTTLPNASTGNSIVRSDPTVDTDTYADWTTAANNGNPQTQGATNTPPVANANGPYQGTVGQAVAFSSAGSNDPDGSIVSYLWDFGDGNTSTQANPTHTYATAQTYTVTLTVTDDGGAQDTDVTTATITAPPTGTVLISEVFYDTPGTDSKEEWIELYNAGASTVDISGWSITDDNGAGSTYTIPGGKSIAPGTFFTIAKNKKGFKKLYGYPADLVGGIPALNNTGDALVLKDDTGQTVDAVAWEGGAGNGVPAGWGSTTDPNAPTGNSIVRTDPAVDTDTYADWSIAPDNGNPQTQATSAPTILTATSRETSRPVALNNYPNPFNPRTTIRFTVTVSGEVSLRVYNILGQVVATLVEGYREAGTYSVVFDGRGLSSGIYFYRLSTPEGVITRKMLYSR
ncbi:MAG: PKD domain-containing protein [Calditrichaeota bacterium]|nr:MAG: PKD domain-containing protein [Calditrichota bacterium]